MRAIKTGKEWPLIEDLHVFLTIIYAKSFSKAAQDMGVSPAYISKRIKILEKKSWHYFISSRPTTFNVNGGRREHCQ